MITASLKLDPNRRQFIKGKEKFYFQKTLKATCSSDEFLKYLKDKKRMYSALIYIKKSESSRENVSRITSGTLTTALPKCWKAKETAQSSW